ncbi:hypothetical protein KR074_009358, partial [Drosophila pseudoananassae]
TKLAAPKTRSAAVLLKRRSRRRRNDGGFDSSSTGGGVGVRVGPATGGSGTGAGPGRNNNNSNSNSKEPCQFVPVRRKPLGEYMKLAPAVVYIPPPPPPALTYAAAVGGLSGPRYNGVKVIISPRLKRASKPGKSNKNKRPKKPQNTKPGNQFTIFAAEQPKPHIVHVDSKTFQAEEQQSNPTPASTSTTSTTETPKPTIPAPKAKQKKRTAISQTPPPASTSSTSTTETPNPVPLAPEPISSTQAPEPPRDFHDSYSYLSYHHEKLQRILAVQTAGMHPVLAREPQGPPLASSSGYAREPASSSSNSTFSAAAQHPVQRYPIDLDDGLLNRCELEATALLAQNKAMLRLWINPHLFIS